MEKIPMDTILDSLKVLKKDVPSIDCDVYWDHVNRISAREQAVFIAEEKRLILPEDVFHRSFSI